MRPSNFTLFPANQSGNSPVSSAAIDAKQVISASFQALTTGTLAGSMQVQFNNDPNPATGAGGIIVPSNALWSNLGSPVAVSAATVANAQFPQSSYAGYRYLRVQWLSPTGSGNIQVYPFTIGV